MSDTDRNTIRDAIDRFRRRDQDIPGQWLITQCLAVAIEKAQLAPLDVIQIVQAFDTFTEDNDPYGTHEFGSFDFQGDKCFWKIDLFDSDLQFGSPDPTDLSQTRCVLTIILASEY